MNKKSILNFKRNRDPIQHRFNITNAKAINRVVEKFHSDS
ncbi:hypothetical protein G436_0930 [Leptospira interrogans serovar Hardjo str. Norma]|uniref:Uncharacterized protein n=1 Tax=Leptospira interrogans serovar Hardjo str. Norma TaxID=1279460 RepID=A0A0M4N6S9_LEPIR|nr:hypothetical protein G436_0930 [Leptospira interrogans serovar Hardjo str. Norma]